MTPTINALAANAGLVVLITHLLQYLKGARWFPLLTQHTAELSKLLAGVLAVFTAIGIQHSWTVGADGFGTLALSGIPTTASAALQLLLHSSANYGLIKGYYEAAVRPDARS